MIMSEDADAKAFISASGITAANQIFAIKILVKAANLNAIVQNFNKILGRNV